MFNAYRSHTSVEHITDSHDGRTLVLTTVTESEVMKLISHINPRKATGFDQLPPKLLRIAGPALSNSMTTLVNRTITDCQFPHDLKCAEVSPVYKKGDALDKNKYRPLSILPCTSKIIERIIDQQTMKYFEHILHKHVSAYRKKHNTESLLLKAVEDWKLALDEGKYVGAILMDLSKAFDVVPHGLLISKLKAYGCDDTFIRLMHSYLTNRKQRVKIGSVKSEWKMLKKGIPQGSVLGPTLFNIFINDIYSVLDKSDMYNYADDNSLSHAHETPDGLKLELEKDAESVTQWFTENGMEANVPKYQAIVFGTKTAAPVSFCVRDHELECLDVVKLFGVHIDANLKFTKHIDAICLKAAQQTNAIMRLSKLIDQDVKKIMYRTFILSNFNYCPIVWMFCGMGNIKKMERVQLRALRFVYNDFSSSYEELLKTSGQPSIAIHLIRNMAIQVFKCLSNMSPDYVCSLLTRHNVPYSLRDDNKLKQKSFKTISYGKRSFAYMGAKLWNSMPQDIKNSITLSEFKNRVKAWDGPCTCSEWC